MTPQSLKSAILQLAIQGKLVPQRPEDGVARVPAALNTEKRKARRHGEEMEPPFDIPESWRWVQVGDLFQHNTGKALNSSDKSGTLLEYITTSNVYWNRFDLGKLKTMHFTDAEVEKCTVRKGDLLVLEGGDVGRAAIWNFDFPMRIQNHIHRLRAYGEVCIEYFYHVFYFLKNAGSINGKGIGIKGLSSKVLHSLLVPLPPLPEQHRIVAKIEELLPLIDRYEQAWTKLEDFNRRFPADMQKSLLQLAIQGKLVPQLPEEGTGEELYRKILATKSTKKSKKEKLLPPITDDEIPFDIPESWKWVRLASATDMLAGFAFKSTDFKPAGKYRLLRGINLGVNSIRWKDTVYLDSVPERLCDYRLQSGDVLIGLDRPWISDGTRVAIFDDAQETYLVQRVLRLRESGCLTGSFIALLLHSSLLINSLGDKTTGISVPHISPGQVGNLVVPLPPLAEQTRIVAKLEELLPLCERLK